MENLNVKNIDYFEARKRVKQIRGFYIHLMIYLFINLVIYAQFLLDIEQDKTSDGFNFYTFVLWGIVILIHAIATFLPAITKWERQKTEEILNNKKF